MEVATKLAADIRDIRWEGQFWLMLPEYGLHTPVYCIVSMVAEESL
jgi:hypothetical protein